MDGGIIALIIIGIVVNMVVKAMRAKMQPPPKKRPVSPPTLGQDVDRPFEDRPRPPAPPAVQPSIASPSRETARVAEKIDHIKGVSMEGTSLEGTSLETMHLDEMPEGTVSDVKPLVDTGRRTAANPIAEWFRGDGVVRGIIMSEVLNPPVSRRR